jgi:hypothetical protein
MVGRFNDALFFVDADKVLVCGPVTWEQSDAGKTVNIEARITRGTQTFNCNKDFTAPSAGPFPKMEAWAMILESNNLTPGPATAHGKAKQNGTVLQEWSQPESGNPPPILIATQ